MDYFCFIAFFSAAIEMINKKSGRIREAAKKKSSSTSGRATKREGEGGGKGRAIKEKKVFLKLFFLFCCHLKIKIVLI